VFSLSLSLRPLSLSLLAFSIGFFFFFCFSRLCSVPVSSYVYRNVLGHVAQLGYKAVAIDFLGAGLSEKPLDGNYDFSSMADLLQDVLKSMGLNRVHLFVHDLAGPIGLEFAIRHPNDTTSITFGNTVINVKVGFMCESESYVSLGLFVWHVCVCVCVSAVSVRL
jgi:alpha/beta hydrolase fold